MRTRKMRFFSVVMPGALESVVVFLRGSKSGTRIYPSGDLGFLMGWQLEAMKDTGAKRAPLFKEVTRAEAFKIVPRPKFYAAVREIKKENSFESHRPVVTYL